jgi:hypothetical protein
MVATTIDLTVIERVYGSWPGAISTLSRPCFDPEVVIEQQPPLPWAGRYTVLTGCQGQPILTGPARSMSGDSTPARSRTFRFTSTRQPAHRAGRP